MRQMHRGLLTTSSVPAVATLVIQADAMDAAKNRVGRPGSPWTAAFPLRRTDLGMYEYACHEGNARSMIGTLETARYEESHPEK
jgi:hypothetical protein